MNKPLVLLRTVMGFSLIPSQALQGSGSQLGMDTKRLSGGNGSGRLLNIGRALGSIALLTGLLVSTPPAAQAQSAQRAERDSRTPLTAQSVPLAELPKEAKATYRLIRSGGPFPYEKDGSVFGNRERLLPSQKRGYWREYTVRTPGARNRGARRIVCGGTPPTRPEACYYTDDHYANFRRIVESQASHD